jgi:hypothetical protein
MKKNILSKLTLGKRTVATLSTDSMAIFNGGNSTPYAYTSFFNCPPPPPPPNPGDTGSYSCRNCSDPPTLKC